MRARSCATAVALVLLAATGCGAETPDYHSVWSTSSATPPPTTTGQPVPISKFLEDAGVTGESIAPLLASTIRAIFENGSVTGLFDGSA